MLPSQSLASVVFGWVGFRWSNRRQGRPLWKCLLLSPIIVALPEDCVEMFTLGSLLCDSARTGTSAGKMLCLDACGNLLSLGERSRGRVGSSSTGIGDLIIMRKASCSDYDSGMEARRDPVMRLRRAPSPSCGRLEGGFGVFSFLLWQTWT